MEQITNTTVVSTERWNGEKWVPDYKTTTTTTETREEV